MTREEATEELKILKENYWDDDGYGHETKQYDDTMLALDMAIKALEQEPKWISVSEKLPESDEEYHTFLVTDNKGRVTLSEFYLSISDRKPYWSGMIDVIAWMPLPKAYSEV